MPLVVNLSITGILAPDSHCSPPDLDGVLAKPLLQANLLLVEVFRMEM